MATVINTSSVEFPGAKNISRGNCLKKVLFCYGAFWHGSFVICPSCISKDLILGKDISLVDTSGKINKGSLLFGKCPTLDHLRCDVLPDIPKYFTKNTFECVPIRTRLVAIWLDTKFTCEILQVLSNLNINRETSKTSAPPIIGT